MNRNFGLPLNYDYLSNFVDIWMRELEQELGETLNKKKTLEDEINVLQEFKEYIEEKKEIKGD